jgi:hypothetical protein
MKLKNVKNKWVQKAIKYSLSRDALGSWNFKFPD